MTVDSWAANVVGKELGEGDARGQCVGLSWDYVTNELHTNFISPNYGPHAPYAIGSWDSGGVPNGMTRIAGTGFDKGDVVFWNFFSPEAPLSHTAVAMGKVSALGLADFMSQNSPLPVATRMELPTLGVAGFWRPNGSSGDATATTASSVTVGPFTFDPSTIIPGMTTLIKDFAAVNGVLGKISNPQLWQRIGLFALGAILLIVILVKLAGETDVAQAVTKGITQ